MPQVFIPFNKMDFEQGKSGEAGLWYVQNGIKKYSGYSLFNEHHLLDDTPIAWPEVDEFIWGSGVYYNIAPTTGLAVKRTYVGGENNIYHLDHDAFPPTITPIGRPTLAPGPAGFAYNTNTGAAGWFFAQFGPYEFAVNGVDNIQICEPGSATALNRHFNDLGVAPSVIPTNGANPTARYIIAHKNHIVIAYVTLAAAYGALAAAAYPAVFPNLVWWSALDNGGAFGDSTVSPNLDGTGWKHIFDGTGVITGIVGSYDAAFIFKTGSIHRMDGPPFQINMISESIGCLQPRSIVKLGSNIYFWSTSGPAVIDASSNTVTLLDEDSLSETLNKIGYGNATNYAILGPNGDYISLAPDSASSPWDIQGIVDPVNKLVAFMYSSWDPAPWYAPSAPEGPILRTIAYSERTSSWTSLKFADVPTVGRGRALVEDPETRGTPIGGQDFGGAKALGGGTGVSVYVPQGEIGNSRVSFRLPYLPFTQYPGTETKVDKIRIRYRRSYNYQVTPTVQHRFSILSSSHPSNTLFKITAEETPTMSADGWMHVNECPFALAHSIEVSLQPTVGTDALAKIVGIDVVFSTRGNRGA